jgi:alkanesulfonate monooxygenase SsuD/methylene tetrahydromethanopterin reductase-like flavin-dependent oxidoreductase (luciferase family)
MRIGVTVPMQAALEATVAGFELAEGLGVDSVWFSQPPGGFDALTVLALAAGRTRSVRLGTAVIPAYPYHPLVTARAARTVAAAAPGRVVPGVSSGHRDGGPHRPGRDRTADAGGRRQGRRRRADLDVRRTYLSEVVLPAMARGAGQAAPPLVRVAFGRLAAVGVSEVVAVVLLRMIKNAQHLGFSLDEIAGLIAHADPAEISAIAAQKLAEIDTQIARLMLIREALAVHIDPSTHIYYEISEYFIQLECWPWLTYRARTAGSPPSCESACHRC